MAVCSSRDNWVSPSKESREAVMAPPNDPPSNIWSNTNANAGLSNATAHIFLTNIGDANHILAPQELSTFRHSKVTTEWQNINFKIQVKSSSKNCSRWNGITEKGIYLITTQGDHYPSKNIYMFCSLKWQFCQFDKKPRNRFSDDFIAGSVNVVNWAQPSPKMKYNSLQPSKDPTLLVGRHS